MILLSPSQHAHIPWIRHDTVDPADTAKRYKNLAAAQRRLISCSRKSVTRTTVWTGIFNACDSTRHTHAHTHTMAMKQGLLYLGLYLVCLQTILVNAVVSFSNTPTDGNALDAWIAEIEIQSDRVGGSLEK